MLWLKTHLKSAHSRSHPVVRQDNFAVAIRHGSGAWSARNGHRDGTVFPNHWKGHSRESSEEETSKEKFEEKKQKEEDSVASFPAVLMNNAVDHGGSSNESADICRTNTLMKTMNRLDELSREAENCLARMKATYLDDEKWYRVYDEASMEDSIAPRGQQLCSEAGHAGAEDH